MLKMAWPCPTDVQEPRNCTEMGTTMEKEARQVAGLHLSPRLCLSSAGCSPSSMSPLSSVCCVPVPGDSLLPCYVVLPSSAWSSS